MKIFLRLLLTLAVIFQVFGTPAGALASSDSVGRTPDPSAAFSTGGLTGGDVSPLPGLFDGPPGSVQSILLAAPTRQADSSATSTFGIDPSNAMTTSAKPLANPEPVDLQVTKYQDYSYTAPTPGSSIGYRISVYNNTTGVTATNVVITDVLPLGLTVDSVPTDPAFSVVSATNAVTWTIPSLDGNQYGSLGFRARIGDLVPPGTVLTNTAVIGSDGVETYPDDNVARYPITVVTPTRDLNVYQYLSGGVVTSGVDITYTVSYANYGNSTAHDVVLTDTLPAATTFLTATQWETPFAPTGGGGQNLVWNIGDLAPGSYNEIQLTVHIADGLPGGTPLPNTVTITGADAETSYDNNTAVDVRVIPYPGVELGVKKHSYTAPSPGSHLDYEISYVNQGTDTASNVVITDVLPPGTSFHNQYSYGWNVVTSTSVITWTRDSLEGGGSGSLYLYTLVHDDVFVGTLLTNTIRIGTDSIDVVPDNNFFLYPMTVITPTSDVYVSKYLYSGAPAPGNVITYQVYYGNSGISTARDVVLTDALPDATTFITATQWGTAFPPTGKTGQTLEWSLGNLPSWSSGELVVTVGISDALPGGTQITNTVAITTTTKDISSTNNVATYAVTLEPPAPVDLQVTKSEDNQFIPQHTPGGLVMYDVWYRNNLGDPANSIVITDILPAGLTVAGILTGTGYSVVSTTNSVAWTIPSVGPYQSGSLKFTARIDDLVSPGTALTNTITISSTKPDITPTNNVATYAFTVAPPGNIDLFTTKSLLPGSIPAPGNTITYRIDFGNTGTSLAQNVRLTDTLPLSTTYVSSYDSANINGGTALVEDIWPGIGGSTPYNLTDVNGTLFFVAGDITHGVELWKIDGTTAGPVLVKDIYPGIGGSYPNNLTNVNGTLFFSTEDGTDGVELWRSDGTITGTILVKDIWPSGPGLNAEYLTNVNGTLFFVADDGTTGAELWKSDGTIAGTVRVKDIWPDSASSSPYALTNVNGTLFFVANDGINGPELWKSDGSAAGTVLVKDIYFGSVGSSPFYLTNVNGTLYFRADDGINGGELWKSDGTAANTILVKDIYSGSNTSSLYFLTNVDGTLFFGANDGVNGSEIWKSDGTITGTILVKDIIPGGAGASPTNLANVDGTLFFVADDPTHSYELWKSDGTTAGTFLVKDINPGSNGSYPGALTNVNGTLFFQANDGATGAELWKSNGTITGTVRVKDIYPGSTGSVPTNLTNLNGTLFFQANDGTNGGELWRSDGTDTAPILAGNQVIWQIGNLDPGARRSITTVVQLDPNLVAGSIITNVAVIATADAETTYDNNTGLVTSTVSSPTITDVRGIVVDPQNSPVPNVDVHLHAGSDAFSPPLSTMNTSSSGRFTFDSLVLGSAYNVMAFAPENSPFADPIPYVWTFNGPTFITLTLNSPSITGTVYLPDGSLANGGNVELYTQSHDIHKNTQVGSNGTFKFGNIISNTYFLRAQPSHSSEYSASREYQVAYAGTPISGMALTLTLPIITGTVTAPDMVNPVPSASVSLHTADFSFNIGTGTDNSGRFSIGGIADGDYILDGFPPYGTPSPYAQSRPISITIIGGTAIGISRPFTVPLTLASITGTVVGPDGVTPQPNTNVELHDPSGNFLSSTNADGSGSFKFGGLNAGDYQLKAKPDSTYPYLESTYVTVQYDGTNVRSNVTLTLRSSSDSPISGIVVDPLGIAVPNINVQLRTGTGPFGPPLSWMDTSSSGRFTFDNLVFGSTYNVSAATPESSPYADPTPHVWTFTGPTFITLTLTSPAITGTVHLPSGARASGGSVQLSTKSNGVQLNTQVGISGTFKFGNLTPNTYVLRAHPPMGSAFSDSREYQVTYDGTLISGVALTLTQPIITGTVTAPDMVTPVPSAGVRVYTADNNFDIGSATDNNGKFSFGGLDDGSYLLSAFPMPGTPPQYVASSPISITIAGGIALGISQPFTVPMPIVAITGTVVAPDGITPQPFANVELHDAAGNFLRSVRPDSSGSFAFGGLAAGDYQLKARPDSTPPYLDSTYVPVQYDGTNVQRNVTLILRSSSDSPVSGIVVDPQNSPVPNVDVHLHAGSDSFSPPLSTMNTSSNGRFSFGDLNLGSTYNVMGFTPESSPYADPIPYAWTFTGPTFITLTLVSPAITGTVHLPNGALANGGNVELYTQSHDIHKNAQVGSNGTFKFGNIVSNTYLLRAQPPYGSEYSASREYQVAYDGTPISGVALTLTQPIITGTVTAPDLTTPVPSTSVSLHTPDYKFSIGTGTDNNGRFSLGGIPDGSYILDGFPPYGTPSPFAQSRPISITIAGGIALDISRPFTVPLTMASITGTVVGPDGVTPQPYTNVELNDGAGNYLSSMNAGGSGSFKFGGIDPGTYKLKARASFDSPYSDSEFSTVVYDGITTQANVTLRLVEISASGVVRDPTGNPVQHANVALRFGSDPWNTPMAWRTTDSAGKFTLGGLTNGITYTVGASAPEAAPWADSDPYTWMYTGTAQITLTLTVPSITGTVRLPSGAPASGGSVELYNSTFAVMRNTPAGTGGTFKFGSIPTNTYNLRAHPPFGSDYGDSREHAVNYNGTLVSGVVLTLTMSAITGTVTAPDGVTPAPMVGVSLHTADFSFNYGSATDDKGVFRLSYVPDGQYILDAFPFPGIDSPYGQSRPISFTVSGGSPVGPSLPLSVRLTMASITGTVLAPDLTTPISYTNVTLHSPDWRVQSQTQTNMSGNFRFGGLPEGSYIVEADPPMISPYAKAVSRPVTVTLGETHYYTIPLTLPNLAGTVVWATGGITAPVPQAGVDVRLKNDPAVMNSTTTDWMGNFAFGGLAPGVYWLSARTPWTSMGVVAPPPTLITITAGSPVSETIVFGRATKHIVGTVLHGNGIAVTDAMVYANSNDGSGLASAYVDAQGRYSLDVAPGTWIVNLEPGGFGMSQNWNYSGAPVMVQFPNTVSDETRTVNFTVAEAGSTIRGRIVKPDGSAAFGAMVNIHTLAGFGNGVGVNSDGTFSVPLLPGTYVVEIWQPDFSLTAPNIDPIVLGDGVTLDLGTIRLLGRGAQITGAVIGADGQGLAGVEVSAWLREAGGNPGFGPGGWAYTRSITDGVFSLYVVSGTWEVTAMPSPDLRYVEGSPPIRVDVPADNSIVSGVRLQVTAADSEISGSIVDVSDNPLTDLYGYVNANASGSGPGGYGAPINGGTFTIRLPAGTYDLSGGLPFGSEYTIIGESGVTVSSGGRTSVRLRASRSYSWIAGSLVDPAGSTITGLRADVFAGGPAGGVQTQVDPTTGQYSARVAAGTWFVNGILDPMTGYTIEPLADNRITTADGLTTTFNLTVTSTSSRIWGYVTDPNGNPIGGARVEAMIDGELGMGRAPYGADTNSSGVYTITVPAGDYNVNAFLPPDRGYIQPEQVRVTVFGGTARADLQFRSLSVAITGNVSQNGLPVSSGLVRGYAASGARAYTVILPSGAYSLPVTTNDTWYIQAVREYSSSLYSSQVYTVSVSNTSITQDMVLPDSGAPMPNSTSVSFDASTMRIITLDDGTRINIPAGALAISGTVTVRAVPIGTVAAQASARPIGLAYELTALDRNGAIITRFNQNVAVILRYTDQQLADLGITEDMVVASYWDSASGSWRAATNVVQDQIANTLTIYTDHFSNWSITGSGEAGSSSTGPDLSASSKTSSLNSVKPNEVYTYTIVLRNTGDLDAVGAVVTDPLPSQVIYTPGSLAATSGSAYYDSASAQVRWGGAVSVGLPVTITFRATLTATVANGQLITNSATIDDSDGGVTTVQKSVTVVRPDLSTSAKTVNSATAGPGQTITYTIVLSNTGGQDAIGVPLTDTIPSNVTYVPGSLTASSGNSFWDGTSVTWNGNVAAGTRVTTTFRATVNSAVAHGTVVTNTATWGVPDGSTRSRSAAFTVDNPPPVAGFTASPTSGTSPLTVQFTDQSSGNITSRLWTFGDGTTDTITNPVHVYNAAGVYTATLSVSGPGGTNTLTRTNYITVTAGPSLAVTSVSPNEGPPAGGVTVTIYGANFAAGATVSFGDVACGDVSVISSSQLTCTVPAHYPAVVDVKVTNPDKQSATLLRGFTYRSAPVPLTLPNTSAEQNAIIEVPILVTDVQGMVAGTITVTVDSNVLVTSTVNTVSPGTLAPSEGWMITPNLAVPGQVRLSMISTGGPVYGSGSLAIIRFQVIGSPGVTSTLRFAGAVLNDGLIPAQLNDGSFTVNQLGSVSGAVRYWKDSVAVPGVQLSLQGNQTYSAQSNASGFYSITNVLSDIYTLTPSKSDGVNGISAFDASLVLRHDARLITLTGTQVIAADVNKNGEINSMDAYYILQKAVDLITLPFPNAGIVWDFDPRTRSYPELGTDRPNQDFTAVLLGDVSGNWSAGTSSAAQSSRPMQSLAVPPVTLTVVSGKVGADGLVTATLKLDAAGAQVYGLDLALSYSSVAEATSIQFGPLVSGLSTRANLSQPGQIRVAIAGASPISGSGDLLTVTFRTKGPLTVSPGLWVTRSDVNEGTSSSRVIYDSLLPIKLYLPLVRQQ